MSEKKGLTPEAHKQQINDYEAQFESYRTYADALKRVLEKACAVSLPDAFVQARPKSIASFAEKCARKQDKYKYPVNDMTDLCGARVIVQTLEQVRAITRGSFANWIHLTMEKLIKSIVDDNYNVSIQAPIHNINWLNELLKVPNFYDVLRIKRPNIDFSKGIIDSAGKTKGCRNKNFSELNRSEQNEIKLLNRLLLEETYPRETPKMTVDACAGSERCGGERERRGGRRPDR